MEYVCLVNYHPVEQVHKVKKKKMGVVLENKGQMFVELCIN